MLCVPCLARIIPRRDPLDGALDSTLIVIMKPEAPDTFRIEETFLGNMGAGEIIFLPGFKLVIEDLSTSFSGMDRIEPIQRDTRILVFLKPSKAGSSAWEVAGSGNCYFWSHDSGKLSDLRAKAKRALDLRESWEAAYELPDERQRVEALWPFLWSHDGSCFQRTKAVLQEIGPGAGDYIAERWSGLSPNQKSSLLWKIAEFRSQRMHVALITDLHNQKASWERLIARRGSFATYDQVSPPERMHYNPRRPEDAEMDAADDIYGILYYGFEGLGDFRDRDDLPLIRESAEWGLKYGFKQLDDAALGAFGKMPDKANLPIIAAIWKEYSEKAWVGNELRPFEVMQALKTHKYPEAIPLMAQFADVGFAQDIAHDFLVEMSGVDFGRDVGKWVDWYRSHKSELEARQ